MSRSETLFAQAQKHIPGGVNSPVRAFKSVGGTPLFFKHAEGAYVVDEDDKRYVDYVGSWGPMILGHGHPEVLDAVRNQLQHGLSYGAPTAMETEMADLVCSLVPSMEMVRMVSSGTEATMSAIRLARGYTGRDAIIKFEGCYHGHSDSLLVKAGSGLLTQGVSKYLRLREIRGKLVAKPKNKPVEIAPSGRNDWIGWFELEKEAVKDKAVQNTARIIGLLKAEVLCVIEAENRICLKQNLYE